MANPSIYAAFERLWLNINAVFSKAGHTHDDKYYTESEIDEKIAKSAAAVKSDLLNGAGGAYDTLKELGDLIDENTDALDALEIIAAGKQDVLIFDSTPMVNSYNPVTSGGIKSSLDNLGFIAVSDIDEICGQ